MLAKLFILVAIATLSEIVLGSQKISDDTKPSIYWAMINAKSGLGMPSPRLGKKKICYDELGCFDRGETLTHITTLPDSPEKLNNSFMLYTKESPDVPHNLKYNDPKSIKNAKFDPKLPFKFVCHGFGGDYTLKWMQLIKDAFLEKENVNVVLMDWSVGALEPFYYSAMANAELVSRELVILFSKLNKEYKITADQLHLIGFSMGGQVVGHAGKFMQKHLGKKPGRVTGLDPACPMYEGYGHKNHIYKTDAELVDVIHTNAEGMSMAGVGMKEAVGDLDFYPNGGARQPGCKSTLISALTDLFTGGDEKMCNHVRAAYLFRDSILYGDECQFITYPCKSYEAFLDGKCGAGSNDKLGQMGLYVKGRGTHYVQTFQDEPYCASNAMVRVIASDDQKKTYGQVKITITGKYGNYTINLNEENGIITPGGVLQMMTAFPQHTTTLDKVYIEYKKYSGWLYSGYDTWSIKEVTLVSPTFQVIFLHKAKDEVLKTGETVALNYSV